MPVTHSDPGYLIMIGLIGTTITPWMQFLDLQASIVEKGVTKRDAGLSRIETYLRLHRDRRLRSSSSRPAPPPSSIRKIRRSMMSPRPPKRWCCSPAGVRHAPLRRRSGELLPDVGGNPAARHLLQRLRRFGGFESGLDSAVVSGEAKIFYTLFTGLIVCGAGFVLIPGLLLLRVILISQVANGVLLPFVLTFMLLLINKPALMGEYRNGRWGNLVAGGTSVVMIVLTVVMIWNSVTG